MTDNTSSELFREARTKLSTGYSTLDPHLRDILSALADLAAASGQPVANAQEALIARKSVERTLGYVSDACSKFIVSIDELRKRD